MLKTNLSKRVCVLFIHHIFDMLKNCCWTTLRCAFITRGSKSKATLASFVMLKEETASPFENKSLKRLHFRLVVAFHPYLLHIGIFFISALSKIHLHTYTLPKCLVGWRVLQQMKMKYDFLAVALHIMYFLRMYKLTTFAINLYRHFHHFIFSKLRVRNQLFCWSYAYAVRSIIVNWLN